MHSKTFIWKDNVLSEPSKNKVWTLFYDFPLSLFVEKNSDKETYICNLEYYLLFRHKLKEVL